jgi:hypothetical protein
VVGRELQNRRPHGEDRQADGKMRGKRWSVSTINGVFRTGTDFKSCIRTTMMSIRVLVFLLLWLQKIVLFQMSSILPTVDQDIQFHNPGPTKI